MVNRCAGHRARWTSSTRQRRWPPEQTQCKTPLFGCRSRRSSPPRLHLCHHLRCLRRRRPRSYRLRCRLRCHRRCRCRRRRHCYSSHLQRHQHPTYLARDPPKSVTSLGCLAIQPLQALPPTGAPGSAARMPAAKDMLRRLGSTCPPTSAPTRRAACVSTRWMGTG